MAFSIKRYVKTAGTYFVGNVLSKLIAVFLLPIYTAYLSPSEYGFYDVSLTILNLVTPIAFAQIWDGMYRFAFDSNSQRDKQRVVNCSLVVCLAGILIFSAIYIPLAFVFDDYLSPFMWMYGITLPLQYEFTYIARSYFKNVLFSASGVANALLSALLNIVLICGFGWGIDSIYLSAAFGNLLQIFAISKSLSIISKFNRFDLDRKLIVKMVSFSIPLCLSSLSFWLFNGFTKICISLLLGVAENGLYGVVTRFTSAVTMVASVFQFAWSESSYLMANDSNRKVAYSRVCELLFLVIAAFSSVFPYVVSAIFPYFVDARYQSATSLLPLATVGIAMNTYASFLSTIFATERETRAVLISTIMGAVVNVICSPLFTVLFDLEGSVAALALSYSLMALIRLALLRTIVGVRFRVVILAPVILLAISYLTYYQGNSVASAISVAGCCIACATLAFIEIRSFLASRTKHQNIVR